MIPQTATSQGLEVQYYLDDSAQVTLKIFQDTTEAVEIKTVIFQQQQNSGVQIIQWDGTNNVGESVPDGNYGYHLEVFINGYNIISKGIIFLPPP